MSATQSAAINEETKAITTHGIMKVEIAIAGMSIEEFTTKFNEIMNRELNISMVNHNDESVKLQTFGYSFEKLETFEDGVF